MLFDPDLRKLGPTWPDMLTKFVGSAGGGLVFVAGEVNSQRLFSPEAADATIDGKECQLTGGETDAPGDVCQCCGKTEEQDASGDWMRVIYASDMGDVILCSECLDSRIHHQLHR